MVTQTGNYKSKSAKLFLLKPYEYISSYCMHIKHHQVLQLIYPLFSLLVVDANVPSPKSLQETEMVLTVESKTIVKRWGEDFLVYV